jgi:hypothetical protein
MVAEVLTPVEVTIDDLVFVDGVWTDWKKVG